MTQPSGPQFPPRYNPGASPPAWPHPHPPPQGYPPAMPAPPAHPYPAPSQPPRAYPPPGPPPPPGWGNPPPAPAVFDIGKAQLRRAIVASIVCVVLGLTAVVAGLTGAAGSSVGEAITSVAIGSVCLLIGTLPLLLRKRAFRPGQRRLVIEQPGIRWDDPQGKPWAVPWHELSAVSISRHEPLQVGVESVSDKVSGAVADRVLGERVLVRIDLFPADPGFHQRHPEMAHLWARDRYRLPLGQHPKLVPQIEAALRHFQPMRYRGIQQSEGFMGLR